MDEERPQTTKNKIDENDRSKRSQIRRWTKPKEKMNLGSKPTRKPAEIIDGEKSVECSRLVSFRPRFLRFVYLWCLVELK